MDLVDSLKNVVGAMKIYDEPGEVLKNIPSITLKELNRSQRWSYCCGFGSMAVYNAYPQYTLRIAAARALR